VRTWPRFILVEALQLAPLGLLVFGTPAARWPAALIGCTLCCWGTDSPWKWRNRLLLSQAVLWLLVPGLWP
jgi:hypothetical protein